MAPKKRTTKKKPIPKPKPASASVTKDFTNPELKYKFKPIEEFLPKNFSANKLATKSDPMVVTAANTRSIENVELLRKIDLIQVVQPPYNDGDLGKFEAATRRNLAVRAAITVRQHFAFGKESKLVIELNEDDKLDKTKEEQATEVEKLTKEHMEMLRQISKLDENIELVKHSTGPFYWQNLIFGRGCMIKYYRDTDYKLIKKLFPINTRRLGLVILNQKNDMEFEGVYVDGQPLDKQSMIYGTYQEVQITPFTEHYGYAALEPIVHIAESHNISTEEDIKEIMKSAWLKALLFVVETAGLNSTQAKNQIQTIIDAINPAKYIGVNRDVKEVIPLDLDPDFDGIVKMVDSLESKIFKSLFVPQFLVQSESIANMATANKSAALFLEGIVAFDQNWMGETLWQQHYEPLMRQSLGEKFVIDVEDPEAEVPQLPFKIKRVWEKPTVEEFMEMADALIKLTGAGIWDTEQANKVLQTPEVTKRISESEEKAKENMQPDEEKSETSPIGTPNPPEEPEKD